MSAAKRAKTSSSDSADPLKLYKQATRLLRQLPNDPASDAVVSDRLITAIALLTGQALETVDHSLDLNYEDPAFLLASAHLQLGLLHHSRQDDLAAAQKQLHSSLQHFPKFVAAHSALGQVLKADASSAEQLSEAEQHLQQAVSISEALAVAEDGLLVDSNRACAAEVEAGENARAVLVMLLCQAGRDKEAAEHLTVLGCKVRLSREVLHYALPGTMAVDSTTDPTSSPYLQIVDNALPKALLLHLQQAFAPGAPFWSEHNYGRVGYFSYLFKLDAPQTSSMHQVAHHLQRLAIKHFAAVANAKYAEFWVHCRRHGSGHQLHYDSDDEGQDGIRHPVMTSVLYLSSGTFNQQQQQYPKNQQGAETDDSNSTAAADVQLAQQQVYVGGPTLVTDQVLGGPMATKGWLVYPAVNRFAMLGGKYLHGVIPGRGPTPAPAARRCTLMIAFWEDLVCRTPAGKGIGACMLMPNAKSCQQQWPKALLPRAEGWGSCGLVPVSQAHPVATVWQPVKADDSQSAVAASYDCCFQAF